MAKTSLESTEDSLNAILNALNNIEVKGEANIMNLLGCIQEVGRMLKSIRPNNSKSNDMKDDLDENNT